ncbi:hypothetical protein LSH36_2g08003 [Paralvinella palmiformis]|uniref:Uncharacterized protein n=1 Tax=Paralvinella palmiformis TaxID=53620 RepID=A0AAD9KGW2_9ANNE|nr:hypothetical protein LSH36_2g08003 [Paralvinella palmiformis]
MSVEVILKNVYTFLDLLQKTTLEDLHNWNREMIYNTVRWARYCTQVYHQAQSRSYKHDLDKQIQELGKLPWRVGSVNINLELLAHAEDLMMESLLQNPTLSDECFEYVISLYKLDSGEVKQHLIEVCHRLNYNRSVLDVIRLLRSSLDDKQDQSSSTRSLSVAAQAELTFTYIKHLLENVARDKLNRTKAFLRRVISQFAVKPGAMPVLVATLKSTNQIDKSMENSVKTLILHAILELPAEYKLENCDDVSENCDVCDDVSENYDVNDDVSENCDASMRTVMLVMTLTLVFKYGASDGVAFISYNVGENLDVRNDVA